MDCVMEIDGEKYGVIDKSREEYRNWNGSLAM